MNLISENYHYVWGENIITLRIHNNYMYHYKMGKQESTPYRDLDFEFHE